ncbi:Barstar (barnase inhibitor) [Actinomadura madurae]|uniref:Barstar (Barnase inhibitor) n=1 Tax=Actinomadura madurae TaxID=1993 RepID=A0A1I5GQQ0_9ACTN|nr:barstar family protein [Actinomadura madurae]SFO38186.1 Barstar (barnase inhibitor) [Actinomadura madurae]
MTSLPPWLTVTSDPVPAVVDGHACRTRAAFFREAARALGFAAYFGHNWDAFLDCLRDLDRPTLTVSHADELLADESPHQLAILLEILSEQNLPATFATTPDRMPTLHSRLSAALP